MPRFSTVGSTQLSGVHNGPSSPAPQHQFQPSWDILLGWLLLGLFSFLPPCFSTTNENLVALLGIFMYMCAISLSRAWATSICETTDNNESLASSIFAIPQMAFWILVATFTALFITPPFLMVRVALSVALAFSWWTLRVLRSTTWALDELAGVYAVGLVDQQDHAMTIDSRASIPLPVILTAVEKGVQQRVVTIVQFLAWLIFSPFIATAKAILDLAAYYDVELHAEVPADFSVPTAVDLPAGELALSVVELQSVAAESTEEPEQSTAGADQSTGSSTGYATPREGGGSSSDATAMPPTEARMQGDLSSQDPPQTEPTSRAVEEPSGNSSSDEELAATAAVDLPGDLPLVQDSGNRLREGNLSAEQQSPPSDATHVEDPLQAQHSAPGSKLVSSEVLTDAGSRANSPVRADEGGRGGPALTSPQVESAGSEGRPGAATPEAQQSEVETAGPSGFNPDLDIPVLMDRDIIQEIMPQMTQERARASIRFFQTGLKPQRRSSPPKAAPSPSPNPSTTPSPSPRASPSLSPEEAEAAAEAKLTEEMTAALAAPFDEGSDLGKLTTESDKILRELDWVRAPEGPILTNSRDAMRKVITYRQRGDLSEATTLVRLIAFVDLQSMLPKPLFGIRWFFAWYQVLSLAVSSSVPNVTSETGEAKKLSLGLCKSFLLDIVNEYMARTGSTARPLTTIRSGDILGLMKALTDESDKEDLRVRFQMHCYLQKRTIFSDQHHFHYWTEEICNSVSEHMEQAIGDLVEEERNTDQDLTDTDGPIPWQRGSLRIHFSLAHLELLSQKAYTVLSPELLETFHEEKSTLAKPLRAWKVEIERYRDDAAMCTSAEVARPGRARCAKYERAVLEHLRRHEAWGRKAKQLESWPFTDAWYENSLGAVVDAALAMAAEMPALAIQQTCDHAAKVRTDLLRAASGLAKTWDHIDEKMFSQAVERWAEKAPAMLAELPRQVRGFEEEYHRAAASIWEKLTSRTERDPDDKDWHEISLLVDEDLADRVREVPGVDAGEITEWIQEHSWKRKQSQIARLDWLEDWDESYARADDDAQVDLLSEKREYEETHHKLLMALEDEYKAMIEEAVDEAAKLNSQHSPPPGPPPPPPAPPGPFAPSGQPSFTPTAGLFSPRSPPADPSSPPPGSPCPPGSPPPGPSASSGQASQRAPWPSSPFSFGGRPPAGEPSSQAPPAFFGGSQAAGQPSQAQPGFFFGSFTPPAGKPSSQKEPAFYFGAASKAPTSSASSDQAASLPTTKAAPTFSFGTFSPVNPPANPSAPASEGASQKPQEGLFGFSAPGFGQPSGSSAEPTFSFGFGAAAEPSTPSGSGAGPSHGFSFGSGSDPAAVPGPPPEAEDQEGSGSASRSGPRVFRRPRPPRDKGKGREQG